MLFLILGFDGTDEAAQARRQACRPAHLERGSALFQNQDLIYGGAMLDDASQMVGSVMVVDFNSRQDLDAWLLTEPFILGKVWQKVEVRPFRPGPWFDKEAAARPAAAS